MRNAFCEHFGLREEATTLVGVKMYILGYVASTLDKYFKFIFDVDILRHVEHKNKIKRIDFNYDLPYMYIYIYFTPEKRLWSVEDIRSTSATLWANFLIIRRHDEIDEYT